MSHKAITVMFADVSGSSRLFKTVGDDKARQIVSQVVSMMMEKTTENHGTVIKTIGDEVMAAFNSADHCVHAAIAIQNTISNTDYEAPISIRIGLHAGPVISENGDVYGEAVNDAAAIVKEAKGGQILTSLQTSNSLNIQLKDKCCHFDNIRLKGGNDTQEINLIQWHDDETQSDATVVRAAITPDMLKPLSVSKEINLTYLGKEIVVHKDDTPFSIGRGRGADLTLKSKSASREHCTIDYHRGKFVLIEKSTNGSYLYPQGRASLYIRREETPLMDSGIICFGPDSSTQIEDLLEYDC